ncbi:alpha/beta hydrolase-fold protein [Mucilaginibacter flavus]|uniref:alpha/beta hydrolase-fold protein n=1 Tax=Mucilaginibacter flavus TaxID=931504 RepID=UPI0025B58987|nr:alpha/beta hydrolase-fold protein [Mucilaginibacter flavus]MDN3584584.1 alpha/beta hydrolase-fold protein [Mucilaginibacter flavus]
MLFPTSFNVYDSYADALNQNGKKEEAIRMYKKSLVLNPNNEGKKSAEIFDKKMKNSIKFLLTAMIAAMGFSPRLTYGQQAAAIRDSLNSAALNDNRPFQVYLPKDYKAGSPEKYDVIYVLDGEWNTQITLQMSQYLANQGLIPPNIVVSIPNKYKGNVNMRERDFSPTHIADSPVSGGGDAFLAFLKNELLPYIDNNYPSTGKNILFGQSMSGLFGMYVLLKDPALFRSYLLADPALWYDDRQVVKLAAQKLKAWGAGEITLWITARREGPYVTMGIGAMDTVLRYNAPSALHWHVLAAEHETHTSTQIKTLYDGLRFAYQGYQKDSISITPVRGAVLPGKPFKIWCGNEFLEDVRYTTDGSEPTLNSPQLLGETTLSLEKPAKLIVKSFCNRPEYDQVIRTSFDTGYLLPARVNAKNLKLGAPAYSYAEGDWTGFPEFKKLKGNVSGITGKDFDWNKPVEKGNSAYLIKGFLEIKEDGYYTFQLIGGDVSRFSLGGRLLITKGPQTGRIFTSYMASLKKGFYPVQLELLRKTGGDGFVLIYNMPETGGNFVPIFPPALYGGGR